MRKLTGLLSVLLVLIFAGALYAPIADPVYEQPIQEDPRGVISDLYGGDTIWADNFTLSENCMITDVHWWGFYGGGILPPHDEFFVEFYGDDVGEPEVFSLTYPFVEWAGNNVNRTPTTIVSASGDMVYRYEYDLTMPIQLFAGVPYYLSIYNGTAMHNWHWAEGTGGDDLLWSKHYSIAPWDPEPGMYPLAFELTGYPTGGPTIPEPITSLLFGGSVLFGLARLRRKQS